MVHRLSFKYHFLHAFNDLDTDKAVGKYKSEENAFSFQIFFLVLNRFYSLLLGMFTFPLAIAFFHPLVVFGFEVLGADLLRAVRVFAEMLQ